MRARRSPPSNGRWRCNRVIRWRFTAWPPRMRPSPTAGPKRRTSEAIAADRKDLPLAVEFAEFLWRSRRYDRGNATMERVVREAPGNAKLRVHFGLSLAEQSQVRGRRAGVRCGAPAFRRLQCGHALLSGQRALGSGAPRGGNRAAARGGDAVSRQVFRAPPPRAPSPLPGTDRGRRGGARAGGATGPRFRRRCSSTSAVPTRRPERLGSRERLSKSALARARPLGPSLHPGHAARPNGTAGRSAAGDRKVSGLLPEGAGAPVSDRFAAGGAESRVDGTRCRSRRSRHWTSSSATPTTPSAWRGTAGALSRLGRHAEAAGALERALLLDPDNHALRWALEREMGEAKTP